MGTFVPSINHENSIFSNSPSPRGRGLGGGAFFHPSPSPSPFKGEGTNKSCFFGYSGSGLQPAWQETNSRRILFPHPAPGQRSKHTTGTKEGKDNKGNAHTLQQQWAGRSGNSQTL